MTEMAAARREAYKQYQPVFWRPAADAAARQTPFFRRLVEDDKVISLVHEAAAGWVDGCLVAMLIQPPPVYDPGGPVCLIDDFAVAAPDLWPTAGAALLDAATAEAKARGAVLTVVIAGHLDLPKRDTLRAGGWTIGSEWWIR